MTKNDPTVIINWDEQVPEEENEAIDVLTRAYAELGKAFYEYRFEEPTPELLLLFDKITAIQKANQSAASYKEKKQEHIEPMNYYEPVSDKDPAFSPAMDNPSGSRFLNSLDDLPDLSGLPNNSFDNSSALPPLPASSPVRYCSNCGAPAESDSIFCGNCGSRLD